MKNKKIARQITSGILASSILFSSCTEYNIDDSSIYGNLSPNLPKGKALFDIEESNLSEEFLTTVKSVRFIIRDIMENDDSATLFVKSPDDYLKSKGYDFVIHLSENEKIFLKAFADDEVKEALANKDLRRFIQVCKNKNYFKLNKKHKIDELEYIFKSKEDFDNFKKSYSSVISRDDQAFFIPALVVAVAYAAVLLYVAAAVDAIAAAGALYYIAVVSKVEVEVDPKLTPVNEIVRKEPILNLWLGENEGKLDYDVVFSELVEKQTNEILDLMDKNGLIEKNKEMEKLVKINLQAYYGLRK